MKPERKLGVEIIFECEGRGLCGKCIIRIEKGEESLNSPTISRQSALQRILLLCTRQDINMDGTNLFFRKKGSLR